MEQAQFPAIEILGLRKVFPTTGGKVVALDGIDLRIERGDIFGVIGMSGAGKSTLIRCINRLERPTEGRILLGGEDILSVSNRRLRDMRRRVGMIFQQFNLLMQCTVEKNVRFPLEISRVPRGEAKRRTAELLELVGLSDKARAYPAQLSGGQKQRVAIARALSTNPDVLLCDEATSALDPMTTNSILALLRDIHSRLGITIVIITHEMQVIREICGKVAIIDDGRIAEQGGVAEVFTRPQSAAARRMFRMPVEHATGRAMCLTFAGDSFAAPVIANVALHCGVALSILSAEVRQVSGQAVGRVVVSMPEDPAALAAATDYLTKIGILVEEVGTDDDSADDDGDRERDL
jgi:D-methionine transport system ATP-binding protein